jgi:multiple sugar transport system substrate-binding protein
VKVPRLLIALGLGLALGSCAPRAKAPPRTITCWVRWPVAAVEPLARRFEHENPGLAVQLVGMPWTSGGDSLDAALAANAAPDLAQLHDVEVGPLLGRGQLTDWSAGVADLRSGLRGWDLCMEGDAIVALPWLLRTQVLFCDDALFARAKVASPTGPTTWADWQAAAQALERLGHGVHGVGFACDDSGAAVRGVMPFLWANGGALANATRDTSQLDSPANREALAFVETLRSSALVAPQDALERAFLEGRLGMLLAGSTFERRLAAARPARPHRLVCVPAPTRGTSASWLGGEVLASFTGSRHKEDALKFARFLVRPDNVHAIATALVEVQPATLGADTTAWYRARPEQTIMFRQFETAHALPVHGQWPGMERVLARAFADVLTHRRPAARALTDADTMFAALLRRR